MVFATALVVVAVSSAVAQMIVPMSASLAGDHEAGRVVGTVMSGLLIGILLARTVSGLLTGVLGWRSVFVFAAAAMLVLMVALRCALPHVPAPEQLRYGALLRSIAAYMVANFAGGAVLSAATSALYATAGWGGVCALGAGASAVALCVWLLTERSGPLELAHARSQ